MESFDLVCVALGQEEKRGSRAKRVHIFGTRDAAQAAGEEWLIEARSAADRRARAGHPDPTGLPTFYVIRSLRSDIVVYNSLEAAVFETAAVRPSPPSL